MLMKTNQIKVKLSLRHSKRKWSCDASASLYKGWHTSWIHLVDLPFAITTPVLSAMEHNKHHAQPDPEMR